MRRRKIKKILVVGSVSVTEHSVLVSTKSGSQTVPGILAVLKHAGIPVHTLSIRSPSLEDIFLYLTGGHT